MGAQSRRQLILTFAAILFSSSAATARSHKPPAENAADSSGQGAQVAESFGFKQGMTRSEVIALVGAQSVLIDGGDVLRLSAAPAPQPAMEFYSILISENSGVAAVIGVYKDVVTNVEGNALRAKYRELKNGLEAKYGDTAMSFDYLQPGSILCEPTDWMMSLLQQERTLDSFWMLPGVSVDLQAFAVTQEKGYLMLTYRFANFAEWLQQRNRERWEKSVPILPGDPKMKTAGFRLESPAAKGTSARQF